MVWCSEFGGITNINKNILLRIGPISWSLQLSWYWSVNYRNNFIHISIFLFFEHSGDDTYFILRSEQITNRVVKELFSENKINRRRNKFIFLLEKIFVLFYMLVIATNDLIPETMQMIIVEYSPTEYFTFCIHLFTAWIKNSLRKTFRFCSYWYRVLKVNKFYVKAKF